MARCRYCARSGWAVYTDGTGLCRSCRETIRDEVAAKLEHVRHALAYVRHAQDPGVQLSLCDVAIESVERLLPYEERRLAVVTPLPSSLLLMLQTKRDEAAHHIVAAPSRMRQLREGTVHLHELTGPQVTKSSAGVGSPEETLADRAPEATRWWAWAPRAGPDPTGGDGDERRRDPRVCVDCLALLCPGGTRATLENLSSGGVFLRTDQLQPPGTPVRLIVSATFGPAKAEGLVRWMRTTAGEMGMGIEFTQLSVELLEHLETRMACTVPVADPTPASLSGSPLVGPLRPDTG